MPIEQFNGVPLFYEEIGAGAPVVLVHGTTGNYAGWAFVAPLLASDFRVITYDRCGRGQSGDRATYSIGDDAVDLLAIIDSLGEPVHLVGHSYGARVAMLAAQEHANLASLVLYEPPLDAGSVSQEAVTAIEAATREQNWEAVLERFLPLATITPDEIAMFRSVPEGWEMSLDGARTVLREFYEVRDTPVDVGMLKSVSAPTLVLVGGLTTSPLFLNGLDDIVDALSATVEKVDG